MAKKPPSWLTPELLESKPLDQIISEHGIKIQTLERYIRQLAQLGIITKERAKQLLGRPPTKLPSKPRLAKPQPRPELVEFRVQLPQQLSQRFYKLKQLLESERRYQMEDYEVLEYLITHMDGDTYAIYIPESFKRKKDQYEQKHGVRLTNLEFLKLLLDQFKF